MKLRIHILLILTSFVLLTPAVAQTTMPKILNMRERAEVIDRLLEERIQTVLPDLMRREGIDMWIVMAREYNEDPVIRTLLPAKWLAARRRTVLVMYDPGEGKDIETLAIARYDVGESFKKAWDKEKQPDQWARLIEVIEERDPEKIGLNMSEYYAQADGLSASEHKQFLDKLPGKYEKRIVSAEPLAVGWLETRTQSEMNIYRQIVRIAHRIIAEGLSEEVIQPGVTTTDDVEWWYRDRIRELGLVTWFHPSVSIQRADPENFDHLRTFDSHPGDKVIQPGDLLHVDFGITYLRLNTDTQQHAYVLKNNESDAPQFLKEAFRRGNRLQDIFTSNFKAGRTGNDVLKMSREQAIAEGIKPSIYTHPIGYYGHAAGTTLGMWDSQGGVPYTGDYPLHPNTAYSIELNAATFIEEWDKEIRIMLEEDAYFDGETVKYIHGRQKNLLLVPRTAEQQEILEF
ncbi:M24 family metallopeptidase [Roseivirga sp. BDSF3-8]|uniref:M24 family metallopeptidase n=1 Tax=Roseivirga sp. BDSF3-8 TaxID=3241598 RepID=UPI003531C57C